MKIPLSLLLCPVLLVAGMVLSRASLVATDYPSIQDAWQDASKLLLDEANKKFQTLAARHEGNSREARFGEAVTLLNLQPKTAENIETAAHEFDQLTAENPDDDYGIWAKYYRARIEQVHRYEPNWPRAAQMYIELLKAHPGHPAGQIAAVKYGIVRLYDAIPDDEIKRRLPEIESLADTLTFPPAKRDLHLALADIYSKTILSRKDALRHLLAAEQAGISRQKFQGEVWLRIADLAAALGDRPLAATYYRKFLDTFQRDNRAYTVSQRLHEMGNGAQP